MTRLSAILVALAVIAGPAAAQTLSANRTFVSSTGRDSGLCQRASPCRSFAYAISVSPAGGELIALDSAGYGPVTIDRAITITGPGTGLAQISAGSGTGVTVNAGSNAAVTLRGVEIDGGENGLSLDSFGSVVVKDSVIRGSTYGVISFSSGTVTVAESTITNAGSIGVFLSGPNLILRNTTVRAAGDVGVSASGRTEVIDCTFVNPSATGLSAGGFAFVKGSVFAGNNIGVTLASNSVVQLDTTTLTGNGTAISNINSNATIQSYGNNNLAANGTNVAGGGAVAVTPN